MSDLVRRLRALSHYCDQLGRELFDSGIRMRLAEAARHFAEQADVIEKERSKASGSPSQPHERP